MQADEYRRMFELENRYWWFVARRRLALGLLRKALSDQGKEGNEGNRRESKGIEGTDDVRRTMDDGRRTKNENNPSFSVHKSHGSRSSHETETANRQPATAYPVVLDLGCGTGAVLKELAEFSRPVGIDMSPLALSFSKARSLNALIVGRGECLPLLSGSVDAVLSLDVFEHIEDDERAFRESARVLRPGGILVLSVPTFRFLWGPHDVALMHFRRYRRREIVALLKRAGLEPVRVSYSIFLLFPLVALIRFFERRRQGQAEASLPQVPGWMNRALIGLQGFEALLMRLFSLPWGSSLVAVARKD